VRKTLPHPCPLPLGEGEWSSDGLIRRSIAAVQGFNARTGLWGNLTPALSLGERENCRQVVGYND
ncbi:MAG TPA: hypothetical protein VH280_12795, partial [Verrucomicrobiae bacterium]|nr:hypothetical protein [Verrucomicrobiae bacterium]